MRSWPDLPELRSVTLDAETVAQSDAVVIVTAHDGVDYDALLENANLIVDSRGVYREAHPKVVKA
jgi:UDP-N-acetyl-D-glucosamine dehydrogenase